MKDDIVKIAKATAIRTFFSRLTGTLPEILLVWDAFIEYTTKLTEDGRAFDEQYMDAYYLDKQAGGGNIPEHTPATVWVMFEYDSVDTMRDHVVGLYLSFLGAAAEVGILTDDEVQQLGEAL